MKATKLKPPIRVRIKGDLFWRVTAPAPGGGRIRRTFKDRHDADIFYERSKIQIQKFGAAAMIDEKLRADAVRASELLAPFGATLLDAAREFVRQEETRRGGIPIPLAVENLISLRETEGSSPSYIQTLKSRLNRFANAFEDRTTRQISTQDIDDFLAGLEAAPGTANTYRRDIRTLFGFCMKRGHAGSNPADQASKFNAKPKGIEILSPQQTEGLLLACDDEIMPAVVVAAFCGLRAAEVGKLDWQAIDLEEKVLTVSAAIAKTASRRTVEIPDNAREWLNPFAKKSGPVCPRDFRIRFDRARVRAGFRPSFAGRKDDELQKLLTEAGELLSWPANCLRHGAISYSLAVSRDIGKVATSAGNSRAIIARHYLELVKPSVAKAFFEIRPTAPANVRAFHQTKAA